VEKHYITNVACILHFDFKLDFKHVQYLKKKKTVGFFFEKKPGSTTKC